MKVVPEKVFVQANAVACELLVVMDGFRLTLSKSESEALRDGLTSGLERLQAAAGEPRRPALTGGTEHEAAREARSVGASASLP
jgi:hypothetical protein